MVGRRRIGPVLGLFVVPALAAATLAGCQSMLEQGAALVGDSRALRAAPSHLPGVPVACMEALASGVLEADPEDPALVWLDLGGERIDLTWPFGYRVRFTPGAEVLAPGGRVVAREGQEISFGGGTITETFEICTIEGVDF
jgi:hypothetical protein